MKDLYREAVIEGTAHHRLATRMKEATGLHVEEAPLRFGADTVEYWIARYAARGASDALLEKAREIGVTEEQWEALRVVAAIVAYD